MTVCTGGRRVVFYILMFICHVSDGVLVAAKAGISRGSAWVTGYTCNDRVLAVSEREGMTECGRLPGSRGVAGLAIYSSLAGMRILARMARIT